MLRLNNWLGPALAAAVLCPAQETPVFRAETRLVLLHASVVDRQGRLLVNLPQKAFRVYEDGVEQQIKLFRREDIPVSMGLIIDSSGSMRDKRQKVEKAALALVKASNPQDEVFIVNFNDEAYLDTPFTNDIAKMEEGLSQIDSRGGTAMRDAISLAIDYIKEEAKLDKKVLVVITDGNDNTSAIPLERLVKKAHDSEVLIYAIGLLSQEDRREAKRAKRALDALTSASGGLAYYPRELDEVHQIALLVAHEIRNQYVIGYTPSRQELDGSFRQIRVTVDAPGRPTVRTRSGYYATAESPRKVSSFRSGREIGSR
ncbi:MAG: VWA domain-containing protein [Bryobacteraceae bacterium]|nr:VWA domain-containing protein [Bryobacteraceae bacterium]